MPGKTKQFLAVSILCFILSFTFSAAAQANPNSPPAKQQLTQSMTDKPAFNQPTDNRPQIKQERDYYKRSFYVVATLFGIVVALLLFVVGFFHFKDKKEYKDAVNMAETASTQARQANSEAKQSSDKAVEYEEKARKSFKNIDTKVEKKLKQIENQGQVAINEMKEQRKDARMEAQKQRRISELFNDGLRAARREDYQSAAESFEKIVEQLKFEDSAVYSNWGVALYDLAKTKQGDEADKLFALACEKFEKATKIKPDYHNAYNNWGGGLLHWAVQKEGDKRKKLLEEAEEKCLKAEEIRTGEGAYNLGCVFALLGDEKQCRKWLKVGEKAGTLPSREEAMKDSDLKSVVRNKDWFKQLRWEGE